MPSTSNGKAECLTLQILKLVEFSFTPVCIVSSGRLFVQKGNMTCVSELQFSCNHNYVATILKIDYRTFQNLFDLGLEYCYGLFQAIKYSIAK